MVVKSLFFLGIGMIITVFIMTYFDQYGLDENYINNQKGMPTDGKIALTLGVILSNGMAVINFIIVGRKKFKSK